MGRKPKTRSITIIGRRWFDKINGNTYFSAVGLVNGELKIEINYEYGYGNTYQHRVGNELDRLGYINLKKYEHGGHESLWRYCENNNIKLYSTVVDVARKRDL